MRVNTSAIYTANAGGIYHLGREFELFADAVLMQMLSALFCRIQKPNFQEPNSMRQIFSAIAALSLIGTTVNAFAHITLADRTAPAGTHYKVVLRVPHGCNGSATTALHVKIPEGVIGIKPMPKTGWKLETKDGEYVKGYEYHGQTLTHGVSEIIWSAGYLPDAWFDEFSFMVMLPDAPAGTKIYFPVIQVCEKGVTRWIEIPAEGKDAHDYDAPAPGLTLSAASH